MAEAFKLRVPKEKYQLTVAELGNQLHQLDQKRTKLQSLVDQLQGDTFSGTDVQGAIDLAYESLRRVNKAYEKITRQRDTIQEYLNSTETDANALGANVSQIRNELPDLFK